ncbi:hypothetical protein BU14_0068s0023 [Porphyra umbilicalis]|uniref:Uncharacterized protein n=1 Tax=Porphyra umbilicalis TaxID=2786 RepID=A0A1X6PGK9_PORUM|nr:hypothetical protein BU14_0068s0023 [Porphyra umbilicalis]|eukprot:OSX79928.1 hypothetical protein BU14_0068s0023 [Porphyra umbilicalis]
MSFPPPPPHARVRFSAGDAPDRGLASGGLRPLVAAPPTGGGLAAAPSDGLPPSGGGVSVCVPARGAAGDDEGAGGEGVGRASGRALPVAVRADEAAVRADGAVGGALSSRAGGACASSSRPGGDLSVRGRSVGGRAGGAAGVAVGRGSSGVALGGGNRYLPPRVAARGGTASPTHPPPAGGRVARVTPAAEGAAPAGGPAGVAFGGGIAGMATCRGGSGVQPGADQPDDPTNPGSAAPAGGHPPGTTAAGNLAGVWTLVRPRRRSDARRGGGVGVDQPAAPPPLVQGSVGGARRSHPDPDLDRPIAAGQSAGEHDADDGDYRPDGREHGKISTERGDKDGAAAAAADKDGGDGGARGGWLGAVLRGGRRRGGGARASRAAAGGVAGGVARASRVGPSAWVANGSVDADMRAAAAAAELSRRRPRPPPTLTLETVYVSGVSRDVRQHHLRAMLADVTGVGVHAFVDADRFGTTTAVTLVADAAPAFRVAVGRGRAATVLRLLPVADPWSPTLLGAARRRALGGGALAADVAAAYCRRRLTAKLGQLSGRAAMPPHLRAALHAHIQGMLAAHAGGPVAATTPPTGADTRLRGSAADVAARPAGGVSHPQDLVGRTGVLEPGRPRAAVPRPPISAGPVSVAASTTVTSTTSATVAGAADAANSPFSAAVARAPPMARLSRSRARSPPSQNAVGEREARPATGFTAPPTSSGASLLPSLSSPPPSAAAAASACADSVASAAALPRSSPPPSAVGAGGENSRAGSTSLSVVRASLLTSTSASTSTPASSSTSAASSSSVATTSAPTSSASSLSTSTSASTSTSSSASTSISADTTSLLSSAAPQSSPPPKPASLPVAVDPAPAAAASCSPSLRRLLGAMPAAPNPPALFAWPAAAGSGRRRRRRGVPCGPLASPAVPAVAGGVWPPPPLGNRPPSAAVRALTVAAATVPCPSPGAGRKRRTAVRVPSVAGTGTPPCRPRGSPWRPPVALAVARLGAPPVSPSRPAGQRTRAARAAVRPRPVSPTPSAPSAKRRRLPGAPPSASVPPAVPTGGPLATITRTRARSSAIPASPGSHRPGAAARVSDEGRHE